MYLEHFGLREFPFGLTPNTRFFVRLPAHQAAVNVVLVALRSGEGFVRITGEVGTGKTLLCRHLLRRLRDGFVTAYVPDPFLSPLALRMALAEELGIEAPRASDPHRLLRSIRAELARVHACGRRVVLLVDEAQALPRESLEALRLLTNLETETAKLLQVVLFGQPELEARLAQPALRQVAERIAFHHRLVPMARTELVGYIARRLAAAGHPGPFPFSSSAISLIHRASRGIPRRINVLCHKAMMCAYGRGELRIRWRHVRSAVADGRAARPSKEVRRRARQFAAPRVAGVPG